MPRKLCWENDELAFPIKLHQQGIDRFSVTYGKQIKTDCSYGQACTELGVAIMHALACDGRLDNVIIKALNETAPANIRPADTPHDPQCPACNADWPWCEACQSYHSPCNPTCKAKRGNAACGDQGFQVSEQALAELGPILGSIEAAEREKQCEEICQYTTNHKFDQADCARLISEVTGAWVNEEAEDMLASLNDEQVAAVWKRIQDCPF